MFSGHTVVCNCHFTILVVATPSRHRGLTIFRICSGPWLVLEALWNCRVVVVAKLKNCRVPSSLNLSVFYRSQKPYCIVARLNNCRVPSLDILPKPKTAAVCCSALARGGRKTTFSQFTNNKCLRYSFSLDWQIFAKSSPDTRLSIRLLIGCVLFSLTVSKVVLLRPDWPRGDLCPD